MSEAEAMMLEESAFPREIIPIREQETEKDCLRREIREELPELKLGRLRLWKEVKTKNHRSGREMSDVIFFAVVRRTTRN